MNAHNVTVFEVPVISKTIRSPTGFHVGAPETMKRLRMCACGRQGIAATPAKNLRILL